LDGILADVTALASQGDVSKENVTDYVRSDERTIALAAMRGEHRLIDPDVIVESIDHSQSGMEQFYALLLGNEGWPLLPPVTKRQVVQLLSVMVEVARFIAEGTAGAVQAQRILDIARQEGTLQPSPSAFTTVRVAALTATRRDDLQHGINAAYVHGCVCSDCRTHQRIRMARNRD